jgi:hypothetical protein
MATYGSGTYGSGTYGSPGGVTVPAAIVDLFGVAGDGQVVLTWTAPDDGGSAITDYAVRYREVLEQCSL